MHPHITASLALMARPPVRMHGIWDTGNGCLPCVDGKKSQMHQGPFVVIWTVMVGYMGYERGQNAKGYAKSIKRWHLILVQ